MTEEKVERLDPTPSTVKKLFAYSGNQCAMPDCEEPLVDKSGTLLGKIAHICAAKKGGARFDKNMTKKQRRAFENLFIVCGPHHDIIDDVNNKDDYPANLLRKIKAVHEGRFKMAERQLIEQFADTTQATKPIYPKNLGRLALVVGTGTWADLGDEIKGVIDFIDKLKNLPLVERAFAQKLAERMHLRKVDQLPVEDVTGAFQIGDTALKRHMSALEHHKLGSIDETNEYEQYVVELWDREPGGNPWIEILEFCEETGHTSDEFIYDLNFDLYDD